MPRTVERAHPSFEPTYPNNKYENSTEKSRMKYQDKESSPQTISSSTKSKFVLFPSALLIDMCFLIRCSISRLVCIQLLVLLGLLSLAAIIIPIVVIVLGKRNFNIASIVTRLFLMTSSSLVTVAYSIHAETLLV